MKRSIFQLWKHNYWIFIVFLISSCQEVIDLELPNDDPQLVIEGFLTYWQKDPQKNNCTVTLSTTGNYHDEDTFNPVSNAIVEITDESDKSVYSLAPLENQSGVYRHTEIPMDSGRTYTLYVNYNNQEYKATGSILPIAELDSFTYRYQSRKGFLDEGYYLYFSGSTPKERGINYYRFMIYENDSLYNAPEDYLIQSDEFLKERIDTLQLANYVFNVGDTVRIEMFSLNKGIFEYYNELLELLFNDGGLFSSPPRNPTSNIKNLVNPQRPPLGFFQVSTAFDGTVIIEED